jgi:hypothetical protein
MKASKIILLIINLLGGSAVVGSYILGLGGHPAQTEALWGGVPAAIRPIYTVNMFLAATGYLILFFILLLRVDPEQARVGSFGFHAFNLLYLLILVPSSLWMSLTFAVAESYTPTRWLAVVLTLVLVGLGSAGMLAAVIALKPRLPGGWRWASIIGATFLFLQTGILDAILWTIYYLK